MKKTKILVPAAGLLLLSTAASVTGTVAWFASNQTLTITGVQVQARTEGGIAIGKYTYTAAAASDANTVGYNDTLTDAAYAAPADSAFSNTETYALAAALLYPTSTANASSWYHGTSVDMNNYAATNQALLANASAGAAGLQVDGQYFSGTGADAEHQFKLDGQYFLYQKYQVKATSTGDYSLWVTGISVSGETNSAALNKSLRVAIKANGNSVYFFAPMYASDDTTVLYYYGGSRTAGSPAKGSAPNVKVANATIDTTADDLEIWAYYEGEDENCKSANAVNVDTLNITLSFSCIDPAA